ncbi:uncharacterized protein PGTG_21003 [Puccinia graminis f. sp. tritici CRL 75-36-700-3]|uniref:Uncharacterized protein n=1 Tax=Puccinia graminis f. sp. tritici (strain CRL 75-36-700-3 / race SCCL) TaxID=418459 RepID=H6QQ51_PUCGT|nr:uncharacterized protein PGTG_21003 [Puccinia graminis f. sp. tritici CRL 75-36-700-3]EHS64652.1 hypothetical protein PGTG_21003 [Puccinia graminis f. sp. tritici CRL 75-36-700-3]
MNYLLAIIACILTLINTLRAAPASVGSGDLRPKHTHDTRRVIGYNPTPGTQPDPPCPGAGC